MIILSPYFTLYCKRVFFYVMNVVEIINSFKTHMQRDNVNDNVLTIVTEEVRCKTLNEHVLNMKVLSVMT